MAVAAVISISYLQVGATRQAVKKHIETTHSMEVSTPALRAALKKLCDAGELVQQAGGIGHGLTGVRYKLTATGKKNAKKAAAKKAAPKKKATTKKKTSTKKKATTKKKAATKKKAVPKKKATASEK